MNDLRLRREFTTPQITTRLWAAILGFVGPATWIATSKVNKQLNTASTDVLWLDVFLRLDAGYFVPCPFLEMALLSDTAHNSIQMVERSKHSVLQYHSFCPDCEYTVRGVWGRPVCPTCASLPTRVMSTTAVAKQFKISLKDLDGSDLPRYTVGRAVFFAVSHVQALA